MIDLFEIFWNYMMLNIIEILNAKIELIQYNFELNFYSYQGFYMKSKV